MAVSIDSRTSTFGNMIVVTGTYAATDTTITLGSIMSTVVSCTLTPTAAPIGVPVDPAGAPVTLNIQDNVELNGTTVTIHGGDDAIAGAAVAGKFMAIGFRG